MAITEVSAAESPLVGVIGFFDGPNATLAAAEKVREARYRNFDVFTPYPVHGMDAAMGLRRSPLPYVTLIAGLTGCLLGFLLQYWTSAIDWPLNVGGKPLNSWPAFVPVMFEMTVLLAGLSTVGAMFMFNGLPNIKRKTFDAGITRDRFSVVIENVTSDDAPNAERFLKTIGATEVRRVFAEGWF